MRRKIRFQRQLRAALAARGLRGRDVALALQVSTATVSRILQGERRVGHGERAAVEQLLGYSIARMFRRWRRASPAKRRKKLARRGPR